MPETVPEALGEAKSYHDWLTSLEGYEGQVSFWAFFPPRHGAAATPYEGRFTPVLNMLGVTPYRHQADALTAVEQGHNLVVATPTASGKSLSYQVPTIATLQDGKTALYLFPTKALSEDQREKLKDQSARFGLAGFIATYDGDTPANRRRDVREHARCILTNPDMLHYGILPHHRMWAHFLGRLELVVIDELHAYRGVMGTHVANILRRLLRLARHYGAQPRVIAASATIGNPGTHASNLTGVPFQAVREDYGPKAAREVIFWRPPDLPGVDGGRRSINTEAANLVVQFVRSGLKSIFFCNSRKTAELVKRYAVGQLRDDEVPLLQSYRAGYTPEDRRTIEAGFKRGDIRVLTATSALELGVDIGGVDAVVLVGYPGSMTAFWQRAGRAGRAGTRSLTLLIPGNDPLDEYYLNHPELITEGKAESAVADAFNTEIHPLHLACAAFEKPIGTDEEILGEAFDPAAVPDLAQSGDRFFYRGRYPHAKLSVRGLGGGRITLKDGFGKRIGVSDFGSALRELHPGAVYLHQGDSYLVRNLDLKENVAVLLPHIEDYYTQARSITEIDILKHEGTHHGVNIGRVKVVTSVTSFVRKRLFKENVLDERPLDLPEVAYDTQALWFDVSEIASVVTPDLLPSAMHALEHTLIGLLPVFVLCERADVGGVSYPLYPANGNPIIFIYDGYPGGVGYTRAGTSVFPAWLTAARDLLRDCPCKNGCPRCVLSPKCGNGNQYLDKHAARALADALLERLEGAVAGSLLA